MLKNRWLDTFAAQCELSRQYENNNDNNNNVDDDNVKKC